MEKNKLRPRLEYLLLLSIVLISGIVLSAGIEDNNNSSGYGLAYYFGSITASGFEPTGPKYQSFIPTGPEENNFIPTGPLKSMFIPDGEDYNSSIHLTYGGN